MNLKEIRVDPLLKIWQLRDELATRFRSLPENIDLQVQGLELEDDSLSLAEAGLGNFDTVHIVERNPAMFLLQFEEDQMDSSEILGRNQDVQGNTFTKWGVEVWIPLLPRKISF